MTGYPKCNSISNLTYNKAIITFECLRVQNGKKFQNTLRQPGIYSNAIPPDKRTGHFPKCHQQLLQAILRPFLYYLPAGDPHIHRHIRGTPHPRNKGAGHALEQQCLAKARKMRVPYPDNHLLKSYYFT